VIEFRDELPKNALGKVLKDDLLPMTAAYAE
jgi:hypothetical protein